MDRHKTTNRNPGRRRVRWIGRKRARQAMRIAPCRPDVIDLDRYRGRYGAAERPQPPTPPAPQAPRARAA